MASSGALPQSLKSITDIKISEFSKQHALFEKQKSEIQKSAASAPDIRSKAQRLLEGITRLSGNPNDALDQEDMDVENSSDDSDVEDRCQRSVHVNIRRFLVQSQYDPSVSDYRLKEWIAELEEELRFLQIKYDHGAFYSKLVTEWLDDYHGDTLSDDIQDMGDASEDVFEPVGRSEMQEQRSTWESLVFQAGDVDGVAVREYLDNLFTTTALSKQALKNLREQTKAFGTDLATKKTALEVKDLKWISNGLLKSDLLTTEKIAVLKEFMRNDAVAQEVTGVLNMRLASLENWGWPSTGIPVEMRRQLNGKYRVFMDEDLIDALLLEYLGLKWSVHFKNVFEEFLNTGAWTSSRHAISKKERDRRQYFIGRSETSRNVNQHRFDVYKKNYFMNQLPSSVSEGAPDYDNDTEDTSKNPLHTKHTLLHMLITESVIHTALHGQFTAVRSDLKWFGPSLSHTTILTVLEYFGVPQKWLNFFKTFLEAPVKFVQDGPDAAIQNRKRGVPMSHVLSSCLGEVVLFCMDYAVNQHTNGAHLYRLHDDFWIWGSENTCVAAWNSMSKFAQVMGLEFNEEKTGTVRLQRNSDKAATVDTYKPQDLAGDAPDTTVNGTLPTGDIRWGFLKLDAEEGRFIIDQAQVDDHINELRRQLSACQSVFSWVKAWNSYFGRFFVNNFAKPAMCFGRSHIDMAISTLSRIERSLFPDGVTGHLRKMIADRFDVHDLPDGFFFYPVILGGLEVLNPYVPLLAMRENIKQTPWGRVQKAFLADSAKHLAAQEHFEKHGSPAPSIFQDVGDVSQFISLEDFTKHAEEYSPHLLSAYEDLVRVPEEVSVSRTPALNHYQELLGTAEGSICEYWCDMSHYWRWVAELYHAEMVKKYGGLATVNAEFMPMGIVQTLKEGKVRWQS